MSAYRFTLEVEVQADSRLKAMQAVNRMTLLSPASDRVKITQRFSESVQDLIDSVPTGGDWGGAA